VLILEKIVIGFKEIKLINN